MAAPAASPISLGGGCNLYLDLTAAVAAITMGASPLGPIPLDGAGSMTMSPPLAYVPSLAGFRVTIQAYCPDSTSMGFTMSNCLDVTLGW